jgi:hypothetical protein
MLVTMLMVASGFLCRYVYTAVPRTVDGAELALRDVELEISEADAQLQGWKSDHPAAVAFLGERLATVTEPSAVVRSNALTVLGGTIQRWGYQWQVRRELQELGSTGGGQARELRQLLERRNQLESQARSLASARRLLGLSRTIHVTLGIVLFTLAFVHIGMALYFATFAH